MEKQKQKISKAKRGRPATGHKLPGTDQRFHRQYEGQEPRIVEHSTPPTASVENEMPNDKYANHKYPPPRRHPIFEKTWLEHIDNITARENFKIGHLQSLEILCDLFVEYKELTKFIQENGRSYKSVGRSGTIWRFYPEVGQIKIVQSQIRDYTKMLGLLLKKDSQDFCGVDDDDWT